MDELQAFLLLLPCYLFCVFFFSFTPSLYQRTCFRSLVEMKLLVVMGLCTSFFCMGFAWVFSLCFTLVHRPGVFLLAWLLRDYVELGRWCKKIFIKWDLH